MIKFILIIFRTLKKQSKVQNLIYSNIYDDIARSSRLLIIDLKEKQSTRGVL